MQRIGIDNLRQLAPTCHNLPQENLRLVKSKESEGENMRELTNQLIDDALGVKLADSELQRVYRPGPPLTEEDSPPRPVVIRFHSSLERDRVMTAVKGKY